jgi:GxxExxY protein
MYKKEQALLSPEHEAVVTSTIACGITVHRELGPGFREHIYERAFCLELESRGVKFECEKPVQVRYKTWRIPGQKIDLIVEGVVLVEIKTVSKLKALHRSQVISYLKTTGPVDELQFEPSQGWPASDRSLALCRMTRSRGSRAKTNGSRSRRAERAP